MESEDKQETETTKMVQVPVGNVNTSTIKQVAREEGAACSWVWRTGKCCKEWFLQSKYKIFCLVLACLLVLAVIAIVFVAKTETSHYGKFLPEQCPSEWISYKNKCYFISEEEKNWTSSQTFCNGNESLLAVFETQEEMHSLAKRLKMDDCWIGLRKKGESFYWENGIALKVDSFQIQNHSVCAYLEASTISTSACSLPRRWICSKFP
ncbi:C-type lectin domain family 2 member B-like isoform 1-T2 [Pterocles gutturalis]